MTAVLFAATLVLSPGPVLPATMTFDALREPTQSYAESGILASSQGGDLAAHGTPGRAHLDDSGTPLTGAILFTRFDDRFDFESLDVFGFGTTYFRFVEGTTVENLAYDNVLIEGIRDGRTTGAARFSTGLGPSNLTIDGDALGAAFRNLDALLVATARPFEGERDGSTFECDSPCAHVDIDNLTLEPPRPVPLPSAFVMMSTATGILLLWRRRRVLRDCW